MSLPYLSTPGVGFGSVLVTFTTGNANGVSFIAEEFDPVEPTAQTTRTTELGAPNGWIGFQERQTFRGSLQVATNSTNYPDCGDEFIMPRKTTGTNSVNITFALIELGFPKRPRDFWKVDCQALQKI